MGSKGSSVYISSLVDLNTSKPQFRLDHSTGDADFFWEQWGAVGSSGNPLKAFEIVRFGSLWAVRSGSFNFTPKFRPRQIGLKTKKIMHVSLYEASRSFNFCF